MTTSESKGRFFLQNESIRNDSHNESNRFESRIGMLYTIGLRPVVLWISVIASHYFSLLYRAAIENSCSAQSPDNTSASAVALDRADVV